VALKYIKLVYSLGGEELRCGSGFTQWPQSKLQRRQEESNWRFRKQVGWKIMETRAAFGFAQV